MCGLSGYVGSVPADKSFLKTIGIANEHRGRDSCGICINDKIITSVYKNRLITDFFKNNKQVRKEFANYGKEGNNNTVLIHTRASTVGHGLHNSHPFGYHMDENKKVNTTKENFDFVFMHNGTITNWEDLKNEKHFDSSIDMDSKTMGARLFKDGNFKVLNEYVGAAAVAFFSPSKKNTLFLYKGVKEPVGAQKNGIEERPLFLVDVIDENTGEAVGVYFSSVRDPLKPFEYDDNKIYTLYGNEVYKYEGANAVNSIKIKRNYPKPVEEKKTQITYTRPASNNMLKNIFNVLFNLEEKIGIITKNIDEKKFYNRNCRAYYGYNLAHGVYINIKGKFIPEKEYTAKDDEKINAVNKHYFFKGYRIKNKKQYEKLKELGYCISTYSFSADYTNDLVYFNESQDKDFLKKGASNFVQGGRKVFSNSKHRAEFPSLIEVNKKIQEYYITYCFGSDAELSRLETHTKKQIQDKENNTAVVVVPESTQSSLLKSEELEDYAYVDNNHKKERLLEINNIVKKCTDYIEKCSEDVLSLTGFNSLSETTILNKFSVIDLILQLEDDDFKHFSDLIEREAVTNDLILF